MRQALSTECVVIVKTTCLLRYGLAFQSQKNRKILKHYPLLLKLVKQSQSFSPFSCTLFLRKESQLVSKVIQKAASFP